MCYSKAEGGLRCPNSMRPRLNKALAAFRQAKQAARDAKAADSPKYPDLRLLAEHRLVEAQQTYAQFAAHPAGQAILEQQLRDLDPDSNGAAVLRRALADGAVLREAALAVRTAVARNHRPCDADTPRTGRSSSVMVQGRTAAGLVRHHGLTPGDRVTVLTGGTKTFTQTGTFRGTRRGGDNNRGYLLIENDEGRVVPVTANSINDIRNAPARPTSNP